MYFHHCFSLFLISVYFSFSVGKIFNEEYASKNGTDYLVNINQVPVSDGNVLVPAVNITENPRLPCKVQYVARDSLTPWYSMDNVALLHYGTLKRDSTGHRTHLELNFAVQTDGFVDIDLSEKESYMYSGKFTLRVGVDSPQRTRLLYDDAVVQTIDTPDILSSIQFRAFYIKIDDDKLQFGKEDDIPIISDSRVNVRLLNYYTFSTWGGSAKIRYCPVLLLKGLHEQ